ncbi:hypothetical protein A6V39_03640 [Candidatus Mycoplasma haematobovis]|uniref:Uncharacterized protein n=1 Tax=Candidatus Mycoplasma haematobovis TaxID=432608 RepID=A0A1A9QE41_9MOLU|nr:hypothetical protein [Candidatus Mycoplasma haematobovis]OAL09979.1 hypothetical protein A6V39_03640 [Candidatus Mycoplasma haematobovis]
MAFKFNSIVLLLSSLITGGGAWLGYELCKPKIVEDLMSWKGLKLATSEDTNFWKALYFQNKEQLDKNITDHETLKQKCAKLSREKIDYVTKNAEFVEKFCLNNLKNRRARIIAIGFDENQFLKEDKDYKIAFIFNRYSPTFLELLGGGITKETEFDTENSSNILEKYKNYCNTALDSDDSQIKATQQLCSKQPYTKAKDKIEKDGYVLRDSKELREDWSKYQNNAKSDKYMEGNTLLVDIQDIESDKGENAWIDLQNSQDEFEKRFFAWCNEQKDKDLDEKDFYKDVYPKFKTRCAKQRIQ